MDRYKLGGSIKITHLVVDKRHHTRFYPIPSSNNASFLRHQNHQVTDRNGNFVPGFVVDHTITMPMCSDFYLQSHKALAGSARSSHYFVLENGMNLTMEELQVIVSITRQTLYPWLSEITADLSNPNQTFSLCYLYARATTSVSYATPAYYADRLCERARCWIRGMLVKGSLDWEARVMNRLVVPNSLTDYHDRDVYVLEWTLKNLWLAEKRTPNSLNPWHSGMDKQMFYL